MFCLHPRKACQPSSTSTSTDRHPPQFGACTEPLKQEGPQAARSASLLNSPRARAPDPPIGAHPQTQTPVASTNMPPQEPSLPVSACQSHAPALVSSPSHDSKRPQMTPSSGLGGSDNRYATSPRHHEDIIYEDEMKLKCMAHPLSTPSTVRIGDVGFITPEGAFRKLFNICEPRELPAYFAPLTSPIRPDDICQYFNYEPYTYLTSSSIEQLPNSPPGTLGPRFRTSASDGAILALPVGALRTQLGELSKIRDFISINSDNWIRYLTEYPSPVPVLRVVTGQLSTPVWGIATFAGNRDKELTLEFNQLNCEKESKYAWKAPPNVRTSLSGKIRFSRPTDTLAITSYAIMPRTASKGDGGEPIMVDEPVASSHHPCDYINKKLLSLTKAKIAVSHDRDWCAVLEESDKKFPSEAELIKRVFETNEVCHDDETTFLRWKPKRVDTATPADLLKDIDRLRDTLDEVGEKDLVRRADVLHSITQNILNYLRISKNKDPRDSNFLLSIAVSNVCEEVKIMSSLGQDRAPSLHLYASTMWARFQTGGDTKFLELAIAYHHKAVVMDGRHVDAMSDLATALWTRFTRGTHQLQDLNEVIALYRTLLFSQVAHNPRTVEWLNGLGLALWERYKVSKSMNDMDHAISCFRRASISYPIPCDPFTLSNLGNILMAKARAIKDTSESDEAINHYRKALDSVTPLHPNRSAFLSNLGDALSYRYDRRCLVADLIEAIRCYERVLDLPSPHHRDRVTSLVLCADKLRMRFRRSGDRGDIELAVKYYQEAKGLATPSHPKYAIVVEGLVLAQREMGRMFPHRCVSSPPSSHTSPSPDHAHVPLLRPSQWSSSPPHTLQGSTSPYRIPPKFRIVSRSHTMKPYNRPRLGSSASDSESSSTQSFVQQPARAKSPHYHRSPPQNPRRHHTMPTLPT